MSEPLVREDRFGPVLRLYHNRPELRNAESEALLRDLDAALTRAAADAEVRVVIIGGTGAHFSAGHDLKEWRELRSGFGVEDRWGFEEECYYEYCMRLWNFPKPTIAQVQGGCIAGAFMVANMCDLLVASDDAFFADPVAMTLGAAAVEVLIHPWVMGMRRAKEMLFTGERMGAEEAYRIGMASHVVPRAELEQATLDLAQRIAKAPPFALKLIKRSLNRTANMQGFGNAVSAHFDTHQLSHVTDEFKSISNSGMDKAISRGKEMLKT